MNAEMKLTTLVPWFGGKRTMAPEIVRQLGQHSYYFEGCAGGLSVIFAKEPSEHECLCDLHGGVTNLAWVVQDDHLAPELYERLQRVLYGDDLYGRCKEWLADKEDTDKVLIEVPGPCIDWAYHYFIASWMGRNGVAGTARVNYQIATRWTKGGGSGPLRFRNATESIPAWHDRLRNVQILRRDLFDLLPKIEDAPGVAVYVDPPYLTSTISGNSRYVHDFTGDGHRKLAHELRRFRHARVVVSYYASPQLAELYPGWAILDCSRHKHLHCQNGRGSKRSEAPEVLLVNGPPLREALRQGGPGLFGDDA
jgi:DNA adenine methylase